MTADIGHNSTAIDKTAKDELRHFVRRIESLNKTRAEIGEDIKVVFAEIKARGFAPKIVRKAVRERKAAADRATYDEEAALLELYMGALGLGEL